MVDILKAVQWWDEWQLRILVLGSLSLQWFLLLAAPMRNYTVPRFLRTCIWLAYISADALSIYALATLFNRHARARSSSSSSSCSYCDYGNKGSSLEVLWAPLLLVYLGGREEITAYTIEDNELWTRHAVTLVSQVTVAVYAFCKSWPDSSDTKLLLSAILLFVVGVLSFCEKPWALRRASINRLVAMSSLMKGQKEKPSNWCDWCFTADLLDGGSSTARRGATSSTTPSPILSQSDKVQMILSDLSLHAAEVTLRARQRTSSQEHQPILEILQAGRGRMRPWLRRAFGLIYTRANVIVTPAYLACHVLLVPSLYVAAIVLFAASHKKREQEHDDDIDTDVKITYMLLCFTAVLDVFGLLIGKLMYWLVSKAVKKLPTLCESLPGHNLMDSLLWAINNPKARRLLRCAKRIGCLEGQYSREKDKSVCFNMMETITAELVSVLEEKENPDLSSYRSFADGAIHNWILKQVPGLDSVVQRRSKIRRSLRKLPFDESVLTWHIATDLCFRRKPPALLFHRPPPIEVMREVCTVAISNYMAYLLKFRPEMLMTGSREHLFTEASKHMKHILTEATKHKTTRERKREFREKARSHKIDDDFLNKITEGAAQLANDDPDPQSNTARYTLIQNACELARELLAIVNNDTRWELMYRVWVGMLCYSASMCRGYLHAKSLGEGGEFLSYVWLVSSLKGTKNLADKLQMPDPEPGDDDDDIVVEQHDHDLADTTIPVA